MEAVVKSLCQMTYNRTPSPLLDATILMKRISAFRYMASFDYMFPENMA